MIEKKDGTKKTVAGYDIQRNAYQLTINNPETYGFGHTAIKEKLVTNFATLRYFCLADEIGANKTYHTHLYVYFRSRVRFSKIKKHFPVAHIDAAKGTVQQNIDYIKKSGKWEGTEKEATRVEGTFEEWGEISKQKGQLEKMAELFDLIDGGYTNAQILALNHDYILDIDKLDKVRTTLLTDEYKGKRRLDLRCIYISGVTGTKKTSGVLDFHGDADVCRVTNYLHPFDHYCCEPVLCLDEFRSSFRISDMLNYCDIYPIQLPARYSNKVACYRYVYIISNWRLEEQYKDVQEKDPETWKAFLRRIHEVRTYNKDGSITVYDSVEEYLNRNNGFHPLSQEEKTVVPFKPENLSF